MRAKQINEVGGAGYSYGGGRSMFSINRGGGFGGANNMGGPNMMYTYEIKPLTRELQPKPTTDDGLEKIKVGNTVSGIQLNKRDKKRHTGTIIKINKNSTNNIINYYTILDQDTGTIIKIDPTTIDVLSGEDIDYRNFNPGADFSDFEKDEEENKK